MMRFALGVYLFFAGVGAAATIAHAQQPAPTPPKVEQAQCPTPQPCKIVIISADEEQTLIGQNMIFEMAEWAMRPLGPTVQAWRRKLEAAPAGTPAKKP